MFISQLLNKIESYDRYGEHRINGFKAVFVLELLFLFNYIYAVPNPYFYYFYVPLTAFAAEIAGGTQKEKYLFYFLTVMGSILAIFLFDIIHVYRIFFIFFVLVYSLLLYGVAIYKLRSMFVPVPLILCLAAYSLIYGNSNANFYVAINHGLETFVAMMIVMIGLYFFPKRYYIWIWKKAYIEVLSTSLSYLNQVNAEQVVKIKVVSGIVVMRRYSLMLNHGLTKLIILRITLLTFDLVMSVSYIVAFHKQMRKPYLLFLERQLHELLNAVKLNRVVDVNTSDINKFNETHELKVVLKIIRSWNTLCQQQ